MAANGYGWLIYSTALITVTHNCRSYCTLACAGRAQRRLCNAFALAPVRELPRRPPACLRWLPTCCLPGGYGASTFVSVRMPAELVDSSAIRCRYCMPVLGCHRYHTYINLCRTDGCYPTVACYTIPLCTRADVCRTCGGRNG
jgi:hypothetical protein